jgi:hypothetical protein
MANPNAGHFFQTSESLVSGQRKAAKAKNKLGRPIKLSSKLLAVTPDPFDGRAVYVAEAAGEVRRVVLEVSFWIYSRKRLLLGLLQHGSEISVTCWRLS